jgi:hypothetical protein
MPIMSERCSIFSLNIVSRDLWWQKLILDELIESKVIYVWMHSYNNELNNKLDCKIQFYN